MRYWMVFGFAWLGMATCVAAVEPGHTLVWADEFDAPGRPDPAKWGYEEGFVRNNEAQYYTKDRPENARVENGVLVIEARREQFPNPAYREGARDWKGSRVAADYTSASVTTRGKASWTYGRVEVRAKLPMGRGMWPAIWMLGTNIGEVGWPKCGEIDIMEHVGFEPNTIHANVHMEKYNHAIGTGKGAKTTLEDPHLDFHVYALEWTDQELRFFVDDTEYFVFKNEGTGSDVWPFDKPHYLILNIAVGGAWGAQKGIDDSIFPQRMEVDYVRVYRLAGR